MDDLRISLLNLEKEVVEGARVARDAYTETQREHERLSALINDLGANHPDGALALDQAVKNGRRALDMYRSAVKALDDLIRPSRMVMPSRKNQR